MRIRPAALGLAALPLAAAAAYAAASVVIYEELTAVPGGCPASVVTNTPSRFTVAGLPDASPWAMPAPEAVTFPSREAGIAISGWYVAAPDPAAPAVVVVHGHGRCKRDDRVLLAAGMLHRNGFSALLLDLRDHGESTREDGRYAGGTEEQRDVLGGFDWLRREKGIPANRIGLLGMSLGAATVLIAFGEEPAVAAAWADSSYADIEVAIDAELRRNGYPTFLRPGGVLLVRLISGDDLTSLSPLRAMARLDGRPIAIVHGANDDRLSVTYAEDLAAAIRLHGGAVEPWIVPASGHASSIVDLPHEYERRLAAFFRSSLGGG